MTVDLDDFLEADRAFHTVLVKVAANPILDSVYGSLRDRQGPQSAGGDAIEMNPG